MVDIRLGGSMNITPSPLPEDQPGRQLWAMLNGAA
jgi:hypothetical protein